LVKDITSTLGVPDAPLLKALKEDKVGAYLFDEPADQDADISDMRCQHFVQINETSPYLVRCSAPIVWSSQPVAKHDRCLQHSITACQKPSNIPTVKHVVADKTTYIIDGEYVYLDDGTLAGKYNPTTNTIYTFTES
jgi:hypothetical protein